jgi:hypothetical protein
MSSTARGASRENLDFYPTPAWATDLLLDALEPYSWRHARVLEPAAGDGAIVKRLLARGASPENIDAIEFDVARATKVHEIVTCECCSFLDEPEDPRVPFDLIVTNPPFALAADFARVALGMAGDRGTVALLLRLNWLGSQERAAFHRAHPSDILLLPKRPEFTASMSCTAKKKGCTYRETLPIEAPRPKNCPKCGARTACSTTDSIEYAWFVWGPGRGNRWSILPMPEAKGA